MAARRSTVLAVIRVGSIPVVLDQSWLIIVGLLTWTLARNYFPYVARGYPPLVYAAVGLISAVSFVACILLHELSHALTARGFGIPVTSITLFIFGGVAQLGAFPPRPWVEFLVALAGPAMSGCIAGLAHVAAPHALQLAPHGALLEAWCRYLAMANFILILFNLIPGFPLDGGRILRSVVWGLTGNLMWATRLASAIGALIGLALLALGAWRMLSGNWLGGFWHGMLGGMLFQAASATYHSARPPHRT